MTVEAPPLDIHSISPPHLLHGPVLPPCALGQLQLGAGMDTGAPSCFRGSFLLLPQHHLLDSLYSLGGVGSRVRVGVTKVPLGHLSWGLLLSKTKPVCVLLGLGTWFQVWLPLFNKTDRSESEI